MTPDHTIYGDLSQHVLDCRTPRCLTCRAHAEMERRGGDVDAIRFERDEAASKLMTLATAVEQRLPQLLHAAAQVLRQQEAAAVALAAVAPGAPVVSDRSFEEIQSRTEQAFERRYLRRHLEHAHERLYRVRSIHTRHAARARLTTIDVAAQAASVQIASSIAHAWYGAGWEGDPLAPLDVYDLEVCRA